MFKYNIHCHKEVLPIRKTNKISDLLKIRCAQCGECCCDPMIELTHHDLRRLVKHTGLPAEKLSAFYSNSILNSDIDDDGWVKLSYGKRKMGLRKKQDGTCMFLSKKRQCKAYEARPISCRVFPIDVILDDDNEIIDLELSDVVLEKFIDCKHYRGKAVSHKKFMLNATLSRDETASYWKKLKRWNDHPETGRKTDFLKFMGF
ncbi:MAG: YkgJ family cysteine cluster protein [Nitrospirota bacterium]